MIAGVLVFAAFATCCVMAIFRPWIGVVAFYGFLLLDPGWNWRWAIDRTFPFQPYLAIFSLVGWGLAGFSGISRLWKVKLGVGSLLIFLAIGYLSWAQSINAELSSFMMSYLWKIVLMTVLTIACIDDSRKLWLFITVAFLAQGYNTFQINLQYFQAGFSAYAQDGWSGGTKGDNNGYTIFVIPVLAVTLSVCLSRVQWWWRVAALSLVCLQLHQIMLFESRGGMLGAALIFAITIFLAERSWSNVVGWLAILLVGILFAGEPVIKEFSSIFADEGERDGSADSRLLLWKAGAEITADYPLLGVGPWCGSLVVPRYYAGTLEDRNLGRKELHNLFFEISTGFGLPAAILYLIFFFSPVFSSVRCLRKRINDDPVLVCTSLAVSIGIPGYFLASMFSSGALLETNYLLAALGYCVYLISSELKSGNCDVDILQCDSMESSVTASKLPLAC